MYNFDKVIQRKNTNSVKYDREGLDSRVIPMWVADMDFETLPEVKAALVKRAEHGVFGYAMPTASYYESVIRWMKDRHHFDVQQDWIVTSPGVVTALKIAVKVYTQPNDHVMVMKPVYYPFDASIQLNGRQVVECPLILEDNHYHCDFDVFEQHIIDHDVKMFILCNPHNPVGRVWTRDELYQMGMICKKHGVYVISDEIHMDFIYKGHEHIAFYEVDESFKDFTVICTAPSKTFNLAALQTSNIIIANEEMRKAFVEEKNISGVVDPNVFGLDACEAAYTYGDQWVDEMVDYLQVNIDYMVSFLAKKQPEIKVIAPESLYLMWVDMRSLGMSNEELEDFMMEKAHVWVNQGYVFGTGGDGFIRVNVACPLSVLKQALVQLDEAIQEKKSV